MTGIYRKVVWYLRGRKEYTRSGFLRAAKKFDDKDLDVDVKNRAFMVTGANSGLGLSCATEYARRGATVYMVCRSAERGEEARQKIVEETGNDRVEMHQLDMADSKGIKTFAEKFIAENKPLHVIVNNAGCMVHERKRTDLGIEFNFAVNSFGPYLLTTLLLPHLLKHENPRMIMMTSGGMLMEKLNAEDPELDALEPFDGVVAYSQEKRQQVELCHILAERYPELGSYSTHPGWADTAAFRDALPDFYEKMKDDVRTAEQGADTAIWLGVCKEIPKEHNGCFFQDREPVAEHLPLAWTKSSKEDRQKFIDHMDQLAKKHNLLE